MRRGLITGIALTCALAAPGVAQAQDFEPGHVNTCFEYVPASMSAATSPVFDVHVHVVLDEGVTLEHGRKMIERAQTVYERIGLRLRPSFTTARMTSDDANDLFQELKGLFGGERPPWAHVVYLLTNRDITAGGTYGVAGVADCIGGVAFDEHAFAMGEVREDLENAGELGVRVAGDLRDARVRLADRRGRKVASGKAASVTGSKVIALRTVRRPRAGVHVLTLSARDTAGRTVAQRLRVRLRR